MDENEAMEAVGQEERIEDVGETQASSQQATQPIVKGFITDIFGEDSDDEDRAPVASKPSAMKVNDDDDEIFADSDDDAIPTAHKTSRLKKGGLQQKSSSSSSKAKPAVDDLFGDDDDDEEDISRAKEAAVQRSQAIAKKNKRSSSDRSARGEKKLKKRRFDQAAAGAAGGDGATEGAHESGDEYDSGEDVQKTAEDENFIDENDDLDDIRGEYDAEEQHFDDERPDDYRPKKSKHSAKGGGSSSSGGTKQVADDPFSKTLASLKKPKAKEMSDPEKDRLSEQLLRQMSAAQLNDEDCFDRGEPAIHKLQLLKTLQNVVAIKSLQHSLLEKDILGSLRDWIEPKNDQNKTLPSLAIRTAVYGILGKLPCEADHLKRTQGNKKPIGHIILALRKHKLETPENKRILKELMEKWCRPIFGKSANAKEMHRDAATEEELAILAAERLRRAARAEASKMAAAAERAINGDGSDADNNDKDRDGAVEGDLDAVLAGKSGRTKDTSNRARAPYSSGFLFTVKPEAKTIDRKETNEKMFGQTRAELMKKLSDPKGSKKVGGVKANPRAMDMALTGRNKA